MAMTSLRDYAACIGVSGNFSVLAHFFGFMRARVPPDPTGITAEVSIREQIGRLKWQHIHFNVTRVGSDQFSDAANASVDYCLYRIRTIYAQVSLGVGRVNHFGILTADAQGLDAITTEGQAEDITDMWAIEGDAIDTYFPASMNIPSGNGILLGQSVVDGPCEGKDMLFEMNGSVIGVFAGGDEGMGRTCAHEVGHYLDLGHQNGDPLNLMCQTGVALQNGGTLRGSVQLYGWQGDDMKVHCLVRPGC
jgi:hypothetical protein